MKISWNSLEHEWRKQLLSYAKGNILEVGVGTGANFKYYPLGTKVTAMDMSNRVIKKARYEAEARGIEANFIVSPVEELKLPGQSFDTIVSTFTLCAYDNPGLVLDRFSKWCKTNGSILLLEYGLSKYGVVSWLQKKMEPTYYKRTGSHLDRDMLAIISGSKLRIKKVEIKYAGMVYLIWASLLPEQEKKHL
jgi:ubiquinone/menaquinone biosynthesis C-methylase UbiE